MTAINAASASDVPSQFAPRLKFADRLVLVAPLVMLALIAAGLLIDIQTFAFFIGTMLTDVAGTLLFLVWWFTRRSLTWTQRLGVFVAAIAIAFLFGKLTAHRVDPPAFLFLWGVPVWLAVWWGWYLATPSRNPRARTLGLIVCLAVTWTPFLVIRTSGLRGDMLADVHWRWTPTAEELFLSQHIPTHAPPATQPSHAITLQPGDWPGFRGPARDGVARNVSPISLDWSANPPKILWKQRVGPAWSSMTIVDNRVFTQEQRGEHEAVVARNALTGDELWTHEEPTRFDEGMSGPGPRATPTFSDGRLYTLGATGSLLCLDPATGQLLWSRNTHDDSGAKVPIFGFSSSPLVINDRVIVFVGGETKKGLLAYAATDGKLLWTTDAGKISYASPQAHGNNALIFTDEGLSAVDAATGQLAWQYPVEHRVGLPASLQACPVNDTDLILQNGASFGAQRVHLTADSTAPTRIWVNKSAIKPAFSDMVYHAGYLYGFDGSVFCCVDANTGARKWRTGHYGAGQALLLADQGALIVTTEDGQVLLLRCNPDKSEELGRIEAITGKAWNHPALAQNHLFVRSDAEMACIELK